VPGQERARDTSQAMNSASVGGGLVGGVARGWAGGGRGAVGGHAPASADNAAGWGLTAPGELPTPPAPAEITPPPT
jgi:hypothetical protein